MVESLRAMGREAVSVGVERERRATMQAELGRVWNAKRAEVSPSYTIESCNKCTEKSKKRHFLFLIA